MAAVADVVVLSVKELDTSRTPEVDAVVLPPVRLLAGDVEQGVITNGAGKYILHAFDWLITVHTWAEVAILPVGHSDFLPLTIL